MTGEQEVNLRLYLCKPIYQIQDFAQVSWIFRFPDVCNHYYDTACLLIGCRPTLSSPWFTSITQLNCDPNPITVNEC